MSGQPSGPSGSGSGADAQGAKGGLTYADAGVDIEAGNEAVRRIEDLVATTRRPEQLDGLGGFAGMMGLPSGMKDPILVSCTDGVGTKLLVAIAVDRHDTVGIDLVAMSVNDLLVTGARPLFLLDYIATGKLRPGLVESIVAGVVEGCRQSNAALLGGETAELPGMYADGHYDLAAFAVGVVDRARILGPQRVVRGDVIIGLPSSGLHSNGYSLARRALLDPEHAGLRYEDRLPGGEETVGEALLRPTLIYESAFAAVRDLEGDPVHAAAHITGGGLIENPPRAVDDTLAVELDLPSELDLPPVMRAIAAQGVSRNEMLRTFNCGLGMLLYVDAGRSDDVTRALSDAGYDPRNVGRVVSRDSGPAVRIPE
jgi:phosphoribosylformylglycinamidine cyclo-ligase